MALTFGNVPHPTSQARYVTDAQNGAWNALGPKTVEGVVWHRMVGTLSGTDSWFRRGNGISDGLTEYGVGNAASDGAGLDGTIYVWNDVLGAAHPGVSPDRSPWASGPVNNPYGDGLAFLQDHAWDLNAVNRNQAAIEISGNYDTPLSPKAMHAVCALTAHYADRARVPWDAFPEIPGKGYSFVRWHQEFTIGTGKVCPGQVVINATATMIDLTAQMMKAGQVAVAPPPTPPVYADPSVPEWVAADLKAGHPLDHTLGNVKVFGCLRQYTAIRPTARRKYADTGAVVGPMLKTGETFFGWWVFTSGGKGWVLTPFGTRIAMADLEPAVVVKAA